MAYTEKFTIAAPVDPEIDIKVRDTLDYYITFPSDFDKNSEYGVVFCITGYGDSADSEYQMEKLRPYISDKYNMLVVGVRYHNDMRIHQRMNFNLQAICTFYDISGEEINAKSTNELVDSLHDLIISKNVTSLHFELAPKMEAYHGYSSFGFMPAIDHLNVLFDIMKNYNIDKSKIIAFGSSYGGYIASLLGKYAPNTFSLIIDNSGFSKTSLIEVLGKELGNVSGAFVRLKDGKRYQIPYITDTIWSIDEISQYYFSDAHRKIRSLLEEEHRVESKTFYCYYHSICDALIPIQYKDYQYAMLSKYNKVFYKRVEDDDIDGELFKNLSHGMNASLRRLFDLSMDKYFESNAVKDNKTDFDLDINYGFPCLNKIYNFNYSSNGISVEIGSLS